MNIENIKLSQISVNTSNPRIIKDDKFSKLTDSILALPKMLNIRPIVVDDALVALGGNMRYRALCSIADMDINEIKNRLKAINDYKQKSQSEQQALVEYWEHWHDNPTVPIIRASDLTDAEKQDFVIKDNVGYGEWDWEMLANDWDTEQLADWGLDIPDWNEDNDSDKKEATEDDFDETKDEIITRSNCGDIWQCGRHRILCGDCTKEEALTNLFGGKKADLYLTDPPYNVAYVGAATGLSIMNDKMEDDAFLSFLSDAFGMADKFLKEGGAFYIWHAGLEAYSFFHAIKNANWLIKQVLIWNKDIAALGRQDYQWKHEPCIYGWKGGASHHWYGDRKQTTVIDFKKPIRNDEHPTMKPVGLFGNLIENSSKKGDVVFDGFLGSGTSLIACEQLDRICYGTELDPKYCDVILARWEKLTGEKAIKIN